MKNPILFVLLFFLAFSCKKDDGPGPVRPTPIDNGNGADNGSNGSDGGTSQNSETVGVDFEGVSNLDLDAITVTFPNGQSDMNASGEFENKAEEQFLDLPALFEKDGEIIMGYFPDMVGEDKVDLSDILFYYFKTYPEIAFRRMDDSFLSSSILSSSKYNTLIDRITLSLNSNLSPLDDPEFEQMVREEAFSIIEILDNSQSGKEIVGEFKFEYQRDGTIIIPRKAPLFAALGVQIKNSDTGEVVYGPSILETESLVLSPGSLSEWILKEFIYEPEPVNTSFKLSSDGKYEIGFTNGHTSLGDTTYEVNTQNRKYFAVTILSYIIPLGLEKMLAEAPCRESLAGLLNEARQAALNLKAGDKEGNFQVLLNFIIESKKKLIEAGKCYLGRNANGTVSDYTEKLLDEITKRLGIAEDMAELLFFVRDFYFSDISGQETRKFNTDISFGELEWTHVSESIFILETGEDTKYEGFVYEKVLSYDVDRGLISEFKRKEDFKEAGGLPFVADLLEGDASLTSSSTIETDNFGNMEFNFSMGEQNSKIEMKPNFMESGLEVFEVNLEKKEEDLSSLWYEIEFELIPTQEFLPGCDKKQEGKKVKFYINTVQSNGQITGTMYFRNIGGVNGISNLTGAIPVLEYINAANSLGSSVIINSGNDPNLFDSEGPCLFNFPAYYDLSLSVYTNLDSTSLRAGFGLYIQGNKYCGYYEPLCDRTQYDEQESYYGGGNNYATYLGPEPPSDL